MGHSFETVHPECLLKFGRHFSQCCGQSVGQFVFEVEIRVVELGFVLFGQPADDLAADRVARHAVQRLVLDDGEEQRLEGHFGQQLIAAFPYPHERILHQFLGPVHGDEPRGVGAQGLVITPEECVETRLVAPAKQIDNSPVVLYFGGCHPFVCCVCPAAPVSDRRRSASANVIFKRVSANMRRAFRTLRGPLPASRGLLPGPCRVRKERGADRAAGSVRRSGSSASGRTTFRTDARIWVYACQFVMG